MEADVEQGAGKDQAKKKNRAVTTVYARVPVGAMHP